MPEFTAAVPSVDLNMDLPLTAPVSNITKSTSRKVVLFIVVMALIKLVFAFYLELGNDEAYYWLYSRHLQWNYFDHPPMVAVWIRFFTLNNWMEGYEGFVRLGSIVGGALASGFLYCTVRVLHSERAGWIAVFLYQASFYAGITAGLYILPDSPQMVFWTASLWAAKLVVSEPEKGRGWILFGISSGLCILCKVHGIFLWAGMGGYLIFYRPRWLLNPYLYVSLVIMLVLISPIFFWNWHYDFITYRFHSSRVTVHQFTILWKSFLREAASQLCFNNPINVIITGMAFAAWRRKKLRVGSAAAALHVYSFTGLPLAILLLLISLFRDTTLPHWSGPAYVSLLPLAAIYLSERTQDFTPRAARAALFLFGLILIGWTSLIKFYPGTWGSTAEKDRGRGDISLDMYGWREAGQQFSELYRREVREGRTPAGTPLVATHWWGAHVDYYFARPLGVPLIGMGEPSQLNHYLWTNRLNTVKPGLPQAYCILPSDDRYALPLSYFERAECIDTLAISRSGRPAHSFFVYRLYNLRKAAPVVQE